MTKKLYTKGFGNNVSPSRERFTSSFKSLHGGIIKICFLFLIGICGAGCKKDAQNAPGDLQKTRETPTIVILGSSTAAGVGANPIDSAWADIVQATINKNSVKANFINLACEGFTTYNVMPNSFNAGGRPAPDTGRNITKALSYKPRMVMISLPNNDIADGYSDDEILSNYSRLTDMLDSAKVQYIIFSTQPRDFAGVAERMRLNTLNNEIIAAYPNHVNNFLDKLSTSTFQIDSAYSAGDGIHLNDAGHRIIAGATLSQPLFMSAVQ